VPSWSRIVGARVARASYQHIAGDLDAKLCRMRDWRCGRYGSSLVPKPGPRDAWCEGGGALALAVQAQDLPVSAGRLQGPRAHAASSVHQGRGKHPAASAANHK